MVTQRYEISNEYNVTEMLERFDSNYIFDIINDKLDNIDYTAVLPDSNVIISFEENFKAMNDNYPGDSANIRLIRAQVYMDVINILCNRFNLRFNDLDENIDLYTAAYYLYDFLVCNRNNIMVTFFTSFIILRRSFSSIVSPLILLLFQDLFSANMVKVLNHIATLDISLVNIFQSVYSSPEVVAFLDNAVADMGNFFKDHYCEVLNQPEILPIIITNIRLSLQRLVGNIAESTIQQFMSYAEDYNG